MIDLIVTIILIGLLYWLVSLIPLKEPFPQIVMVLFIIWAVLVVLNFFGVGHVTTGPWHLWRGTH